MHLVNGKFKRLLSIKYNCIKWCVIWRIVCHYFNANTENENNTSTIHKVTYLSNFDFFNERELIQTPNSNAGETARTKLINDQIMEKHSTVATSMVFENGIIYTQIK